jgi:TRAP-type mannitol/chloroaromatic compound transport system substrate-binding protein
MMAKYDAANPAALKRLLAGGTQLRAFPKPVLDACFTEAQKVFAETNAKNPEFKKIYDHYTAFQRDQIPWGQVVEGRFDQFMAGPKPGAGAAAAGAAKK